MKDLIFELYFENTNINCIRLLVNKLKYSINNLIEFDSVVNGLEFDIFTTPKRLALILKTDKIITYLKRGIKISDEEKYLQYFLKKIGAKDKKDLLIIDDRYYFKQIVNNYEIFSKIKENINKVLQEVFLTTYNHKNLLLNLKSIFFIINNKVEYIDFNNIKSNEFIYCNNLSKQITTNKEYFDILQKNNIYFDELKRKENILQKLHNIESTNKNEFISNILLITENPQFLSNKIKFSCNELFLKILQKVLKDNYILFLKDEYLHFVYLDRNKEDNSFHKIKIEKSISKVNNLIKINSKDYNKRSKEYKYIFNENRLTRLNKITKLISLWVPNSNIAEVNDILSCFVYKNSNLLDNNTELNLLIKQYIMLQNNSNINFIDTVIDSFKPFGKKGNFPTIPTSIAIAIASKIDNIIYYSILRELKFNFDKQKEKDNYNDLLNILIYNNIDLPLKLIFDFSLKNFINETVSKKKNRSLLKKHKLNKVSITNGIIETFYDKLYFYILNNDNCKGVVLNFLMTTEINNISKNKNRCNVMKLYHKIKSICRFFDGSTRNIDYITTSYKRISNLLNENVISPIRIIRLILKPKKFVNKEEENLYKNYFILRKNIKLLTSKHDYTSILNSLFDFSRAVNDFLNKNYVNKSGIFRKNKYVKLLCASKSLYDRVLNFGGLM